MRHDSYWTYIMSSQAEARLNAVIHLVPPLGPLGAPAGKRATDSVHATAAGSFDSAAPSRRSAQDEREKD